LRPRGASSGGAAQAPEREAPAGRRNANEPTAPEMMVGGMPAHDMLTSPESAMVRDQASGRSPGSNPIELYETPPPLPMGPGQQVAPGQLWSDDSEEVLRQGRAHAPRAQPPMPDLPPPPHARATLLRPPTGLGMSPFPPPIQRETVPVWVLAVAFLVSAGVGLGLTVLIGSLIV
jgi:hypothetical protein